MGWHPNCQLQMLFPWSPSLSSHIPLPPPSSREFSGRLTDPERFHFQGQWPRAFRGLDVGVSSRVRGQVIVAQFPDALFRSLPVELSVSWATLDAVLSPDVCVANT